MSRDHSGAEDGSKFAWTDGRPVDRSSNFFHPDANAPARSRRSRRADKRRQRREKRRAPVLTIAVVLLAVAGLVALVLMAQALRPGHL